MLQFSWSDLPILVQVEQIECFEQVLFSKHLANIGTCSDKLRELYLTITIKIYILYYIVQFLIKKNLLTQILLESILQLIYSQYTIMVLV